MADDSKDGFSLRWPSLLAVMALVGGLYWKQSALHSPRPAEKAALEHALVGDQVVQARLWQDPLEAVHAYVKRDDSQTPKNNSVASGNKAKANFAEMASQIRRQAKRNRDITVFLKFVPGGPYAEDVEVRLRARYAVLSALGVSGYVPMDQEHLGYFELPWPRGAELDTMCFEQIQPLREFTNGTNPRLLVPFEWFEPNQLQTPRRRTGLPARQAVLVLWLTLDHFQDHPAKRLAQLVYGLREAVDLKDTNNFKPSFVVFDPSLRDLCNEILPARSFDKKCTNTLRIANILAGVDVYSAWSTTADALLVPEPLTNSLRQPVADEVRPTISETGNHGRKSNRRGTAKELLGRVGLNLVNATCTDYDLTRELIDELRSRGVDLMNEQHLVALMSESDTFYGRALPITFAAEVRWRSIERHVTKDCLTNLDALVEHLKERPAREPIFTHIYKQLSEKTRRLMNDLPAKASITNKLHIALAKDLDQFIQKDFLRHEDRFKQHEPPSDVRELMSVVSTNAPAGKITSDLARLNRLLLDEILTNCLASSRWENIAERLRQNPRSWPTNLLRATYFRGVDGLLPGEAMPDTEPGKKGTRQNNLDEMARPYGRSQLDYLPRLALQLRQFEMEAESTGRSLKAIGVLGSDVYDKLLLLQALHDLFPKAIFFTTDLDARLCHPAELKATRNLIVVSSFDLGLEKSVRGRISPFRDSYQTAQYLSTMVALRRSNDGPPSTTVAPRLNTTNWLDRIQVRRFEVGRTGPYLLEPPKKTNTSRIYPSRPSGLPGWPKLVCGLGALALSVWLLMRHSQVAWDTLFAREGMHLVEKRLYWLLLIGMIVLGGALAGVILWDHLRDGGEPFALMAGISLWPTEILRLLAFGLGCYFLTKATYDLQRNDAALGEEFLREDNSKGKDERPMSKRVKNFIRELRAWKLFLAAPTAFAWKGPEGKTVKAPELWKQYQGHGCAANRCRRYFLATLLFIGFATLVSYVFGLPFRAYRGQLCNWTDWVLMVLSMGILIALVFFVLDATLLCRRFVTLLSERPTEWPDTLLEHHAKLRGVAKHHLDEWLDVQFIAKRTQAAGQLIYYPFVVLFIIMVAHNSFFDHWQWPLSLLLVFGVLLAYVFYGAVTLRRTAAKARDRELERLQEKLCSEIACGHKDVADRLQQLIDEIKSNEQGAFAPLRLHPMVRALALPFGGAGALAGLEYLALI